MDFRNTVKLGNAGGFGDTGKIPVKPFVEGFEVVLE